MLELDLIHVSKMDAMFLILRLYPVFILLNTNSYSFALQDYLCRLKMCNNIITLIEIIGANTLYF